MPLCETISVGGTEYRMRASALIPRIYRAAFSRDVVTDMAKLESALKEIQNKKSAGFGTLDLEIFENVAWAMCKAADPEVPDTVVEWLDQIDGVFSIYEALPQILKMWKSSQMTTATPAKK